MRAAITHIWAATVALGLAGCNAATNSSGLLSPNTKADAAFAYSNEEAVTGSSVPDDARSAGKKYFRSGQFNTAEQYFRRAVEQRPHDAQAWIDLAASCDRLHRFDLADHAYAQAVQIAGSTGQLLNNQGYSYFLRGDYARARQYFVEAKRKDPANRFAQNNLRLLTTSAVR